MIERVVFSDCMRRDKMSAGRQPESNRESWYKNHKISQILQKNSIGFHWPRQSFFHKNLQGSAKIGIVETSMCMHTGS